MMMNFYFFKRRFISNHSLLASVLGLLLFAREAHFKEDCKLLDEKDETQSKLLEKIEPLKGKNFTIKSDSQIKQQYVVGICARLQNQKPPDEAGSVLEYLDGKTSNYTLGQITATELTEGNNWIMLAYYHGDKCDSSNGSSKATNIMIVCNPDKSVGELRFVAERQKTDTNHCLYLFELESKLACSDSPIKEVPGLSHGSVFCILFFTGVGIYLMLGFLYQRLVIGAQGLEQIPNYPFWREFGNLQADGCDFLCRCGSKREPNSYRGIDERLPREDERDDQLLNM